MPPYTAAFLTRLSADFLLAFLILALLISYAAAGLASRLARGLAFAASAVLCAVAKVSCFNGLDMFHGNASKNNIAYKVYHNVRRLSRERNIFLQSFVKK